MKKFLAILLALLMVFTLVACGVSENTDEPEDTKKTENTQSAGKTEQTTTTENVAADDAKHPVLDLCGLTVADIEAGVTTLGEDYQETESGFSGVMFPAELNFENFEKWVNALAENCRKASKDGKLYESEMSEEEVTSFSLDPNALMNVVLFIYRTNGKVVYVTASYAVTGSAFSCKLEVY